MRQHCGAELGFQRISLILPTGQPNAASLSENKVMPQATEKQMISQTFDTIGTIASIPR